MVHHTMAPMRASFMVAMTLLLAGCTSSPDADSRSPSATSVIDSYSSSELRAYGDPTGYLPAVARAWTRKSNVEKIGANVASASYVGPNPPPGVGDRCDGAPQPD